MQQWRLCVSSWGSLWGTIKITLKLGWQWGARCSGLVMMHQNCQTAFTETFVSLLSMCFSYFLIMDICCCSYLWMLVSLLHAGYKLEVKNQTWCHKKVPVTKLTDYKWWCCIMGWQSFLVYTAQSSKRRMSMEAVSDAGNIYTHWCDHLPCSVLQCHWWKLRPMRMKLLVTSGGSLMFWTWVNGTNTSPDEGQLKGKSSIIMMYREKTQCGLVHLLWRTS